MKARRDQSEGRPSVASAWACQRCGRPAGTRAEPLFGIRGDEPLVCRRLLVRDARQLPGRRPPGAARPARRARRWGMSVEPVAVDLDDCDSLDDCDIRVRRTGRPPAAPRPGLIAYALRKANRALAEAGLELVVSPRRHGRPPRPRKDTP